MTGREAAEAARIVIDPMLPVTRGEDRFLRDRLYDHDAPSPRQAQWLRDLHRRALEWRARSRAP
jgi:hypothetical protein